MTITKLIVHAVKCPCCKRKLMNINTDQRNEPIVEILIPEERLKYDAEIRCSSCKSYVGVINK